MTMSGDPAGDGGYFDVAAAVATLPETASTLLVESAASTPDPFMGRNAG